MKKPVVWIALAFAAGVGVLMWQSLRGLTAHRVEVCIEYDGRGECRTASGESQEQALRTATENACALLANGMSATIACQNTTPKSVKWLEAK
jgi:hypothetical protein